MIALKILDRWEYDLISIINLEYLMVFDYNIEYEETQCGGWITLIFEMAKGKTKKYRSRFYEDEPNLSIIDNISEIIEKKTDGEIMI